MKIGQPNDPSVAITSNSPSTAAKVGPEAAKALMATSAGNIRTCRACGCDDFHACEGGCSWTEQDLCSACAGKEKDPS